MEGCSEWKINPFIPNVATNSLLLSQVLILLSGTIKSHISRTQNHRVVLTIRFMVSDTFINIKGVNICRSLCCPNHDDFC